MKALIVQAHENTKSFCSALAQLEKTELENLGYEIIISDLYLLEFDPVGSKKDFTQLSEHTYYKYPMEQLHAAQNGHFNRKLQIEIDKLIAADVLIFNFPIWWYSMPAILKGWVDRVMAYGIAYGKPYGVKEKGRFVGRKAMVSVTTGSPYDPNEQPSINDILKNVNEGILEYVGYQVLDPFIAYGVSRISQQERLSILEDLKIHLKSNFQLPD